MNKILFVVEMLRNDDREQHSYVLGVFDDELQALKAAWEHMNYRAGKYGAEVSGFVLNGGERVYHHKLSSWDAFASSCKSTAASIEKMIKTEEVNDHGDIEDKHDSRD